MIIIKNKILPIVDHSDYEIFLIGVVITKYLQKKEQCFVLILGEDTTLRDDKRDFEYISKVDGLHRNAFNVVKVIGYKYS